MPNIKAITSNRTARAIAASAAGLATALMAARPAVAIPGEPGE